MTDARCGVRSNPVPAFLELPAATGGNTHTHPSHHQSGRSPAPAAFFFLGPSLLQHRVPEVMAHVRGRKSLSLLSATTSAKAPEGDEGNGRCWDGDTEMCRQRSSSPRKTL